MSAEETVAASGKPTRAAVVGVGKMGLSHLSIVRALPNVEVVGVCDASDFLLDVLRKYTGVETFKDAERMFDETQPEAVIIATPTGSHAKLVSAALSRGINVFCEKPLTLGVEDSLRVAREAEARGLVAQVGYHNHYVGTFREAKKLVDEGAIGKVSHVLAEAYGPVVLKAKGSTWRSRRSTGGGCLYDYAAHPLDLVNWYFGVPDTVRGTVLKGIFSTDIDDEVYSTLSYQDGPTVQISVNWSDESFRKMTTLLTITGNQGRIVVDRQEIRVYLRDTAKIPEGYRAGWNTFNITELTPTVPFYLRGEEYSAQLASFIEAVRTGEGAAEENSFSAAAATDQIIDMLIADAEGRASSSPSSSSSSNANLKSNRSRNSQGPKGIQSRFQFRVPPSLGQSNAMQKLREAKRSLEKIWSNR